jgi:hypothetical protein
MSRKFLSKDIHSEKSELFSVIRKTIAPFNNTVTQRGVLVSMYVHPLTIETVECVYWTEPKATCRSHRNPAKCVE